MTSCISVMVLLLCVPGAFNGGRFTSWLPGAPPPLPLPSIPSSRPSPFPLLLVFRCFFPFFFFIFLLPPPPPNPSNPPPWTICVALSFLSFLLSLPPSLPFVPTPLSPSLPPSLHSSSFNSGPQSGCHVDQPAYYYGNECERDEAAD